MTVSGKVLCAINQDELMKSSTWLKAAVSQGIEPGHMIASYTQVTFPNYLGWLPSMVAWTLVADKFWEAIMCMQCAFGWVPAIIVHMH